MEAVMERASEKKDASYTIIGAAIEVHRALGPGFSEGTYEQALCIELRARGIPFARQEEVKATYKGEVVGSGRVDLFVDRSVIVELKAVDAIAPIHIAQTLSYMRMTGCRLGLIFNFNVRTLKDGGIERVTLAPI